MTISETQVHLATNGDTAMLGGVGSGANLISVNVNKGGIGAILTLRVANSTGAVIAVITASTPFDYQYGCLVNNGIYCALTGGNADVTVCGG